MCTLPPLVKHKLDFDAALELIVMVRDMKISPINSKSLSTHTAMVDRLVEKFIYLKHFKTQQGSTAIALLNVTSSEFASWSLAQS